MRRAPRTEQPAPDSGPVSVVLPRDLKAQVAAEAKRRGLKLSPAVRVLVAERLREIAEEETVSRAEAWQRAQAWASFERLREGEAAEASREALARVFTNVRGAR